MYLINYWEFFLGTAISVVNKICKVNFLSVLRTFNYFYCLITNDNVTMDTLMFKAIMIQFNNLFVCM